MVLSTYQEPWFHCRWLRLEPVEGLRHLDSVPCPARKRLFHLGCLCGPLVTQKPQGGGAAGPVSGFCDRGDHRGGASRSLGEPLSLGGQALLATSAPQSASEPAARLVTRTQEFTLSASVVPLDAQGQRSPPSERKDKCDPGSLSCFI